MDLTTPAAPATIDVAQSIAHAPGYWVTVLSRLKLDKTTIFFGIVGAFRNNFNHCTVHFWYRIK